MPGDVTETNVGIVLSRESLQMPHFEAETPGTPRRQRQEDEDEGLVFGSALVQPPVDPKAATDAVKKSGELAAVVAGVAEGTAGAVYAIVPRAQAVLASGFKLDDPRTWPEEAQREHARLQVLVQTGFRGEGAQSLRQGFYAQCHDRAILGWGGVVVFRSAKEKGEDGLPPPPTSLGRFEAVGARFTRAAREPTMVPIPVTLIDGSTLWVEEPRHFRRICFESRGRRTWYKQYGDWRAMDSRTGHYSTSARRLPPVRADLPASYRPGVLPSGARPALEVMHWSTSFPGAAPYGMSAWHSEMANVEISAEAAALLYSHLKSGLHGVILAAATRPFDDITMKHAIKTIDELGRGRRGMGALIEIALVPQDSGSQNLSIHSMMNGAAATAERGQVVFHQLDTKLPQEVMDGSIRESSGTAFAHAERMPAIVLGKSDSYNFSTANAAWEVTNRLRFMPDIEARNMFLSRFTVEMGARFWTIECQAAKWSEDVPLAGIASVIGQNGGIKLNDAMKVLADSAGVQFRPFEQWWGEVPMPILQAVFRHTDPPAMLKLLGMPEAAALWEASDPEQLVKGVADRVGEVNDASDPAPGVTNG